MSSAGSRLACWISSWILVEHRPADAAALKEVLETDCGPVLHRPQDPFEGCCVHGAFLHEDPQGDPARRVRYSSRHLGVLVNGIVGCAWPCVMHADLVKLEKQVRTHWYRLINALVSNSW